MAEALGVAASVLQIIDAVNKLKELWNSVRSAPDDLVDCVHDIQRTARLLDKSKNLVSSSIGISDDHLTECVQDLENALTALQAVILHLQKGLQQNKRLGALRIVLKKDEIARGRRKLERAQLLLNIAQQNLALTLQLQHTSILNQNHALLLQVYSVVQTTTQNIPTYPDPAHISTSGTRSTVPHKLCNTQLGTSSSRSISPRSRKANSFHSIRLPRWLTTRCFEVVIHREMSSLQFTFVSYNVVDSASHGHMAVEVGDLKRLKELLETGQASFFDQSHHGETLLQTALWHPNVEIAQFLIVQCPVLGRRTAIAFWKNLIYFMVLLLDMKDLARYFRILSQIWDLLTKCVDVDEDVLHEFERHFQAFGSLLGSWAEWLPIIPKAAYFGVEVLPREARMCLATRTISYDVFKHLTGTEISTHEVLTLNLHGPRDHVYLLEQMLGLELRGDRDALLRWSPVVREIFEFDRRQGPEYRWSSCPLRLILYDALSKLSLGDKPLRVSCLPEFWNKKLQDWVQYLEDIGIDLMHYGHREPRNSQAWYWKALLCYGPRAIDWKLFFVPDGVEYEWAGEFWNWIENPELFFLPGAFPTDETDDCQDSRDWLLEHEAYLRETRRERWEQKHTKMSSVSNVMEQS